jgi:hypothetical protein
LNQSLAKLLQESFYPTLLFDERYSGFKGCAEVICFLWVELDYETTATFEWNAHD